MVRDKPALVLAKVTYFEYATRFYHVTLMWQTYKIGTARFTINSLHDWTLHYERMHVVSTRLGWTSHFQLCSLMRVSLHPLSSSFFSSLPNKVLTGHCTDSTLHRDGDKIAYILCTTCSTTWKTCRSSYGISLRVHCNSCDKVMGLRLYVTELGYHVLLIYTAMNAC